jgi:hypothetical protein
VPTRARNLSPRSLHQGNFCDTGSDSHAIPLGDNHWTKTSMMSAVLHLASGKQTQYKDIMQHPTLGPKYKTGFGNETGSLCQGIIDTQGTNTCFFVEISNILKERKITDGKLICNQKLSQI